MSKSKRATPARPDIRVVRALRSVCLLAVALLGTACKVSSPVVPAGKDTYLVSSHVGACVSCSAAVTGLQTANKFCAKMSKFAVVRNTNSVTNFAGYNVSNELIFSCVDENDPDYKRPNLRKDNGVTTVDQIQR
jgi:hypothetical protein